LEIDTPPIHPHCTPAAIAEIWPKKYIGFRSYSRLYSYGPAVWWTLYGDVPAGEDPEWDSAVKTILEKAATKKPKGSPQ